MRATAQISKCTLRISCDVTVFQFGNQLAFISFSTVTKHLQSICLGNVLSDNRFFLSHQFSHLFLNGRQVSFLDSRFTRVHIIVETVFDSRTYTELDARIEFLQSFGQQVGTYCFTGRAAVIYMRIRKAGGGGDFMRTQRARTVMSTLADQCRTFTYDQARDLVDVIMKNNLQTNMTLDDMIAAMEQALKLRTCVIEELRIPQDDAVHPISYAGMAVQEVDWVMSREDMANFLSSGWLVIDDNDEDDPIDF